MWDATVSAEPVQYRLDPQAGVDGEPVGSSSRAGLAAFLRFVHQVGLERVLRERVRLPVQERRTGFTVVHKAWRCWPSWPRAASRPARRTSC